MVTTEYALAINNPLKPEAMQAADSRAYWTGATGAMSGRERKRRLSRASHLSRYPMEQVKRVDRPTTLILDDEVPRVPHRAAFFHRVGAGDLGAKAARVTAFCYKHPLSYTDAQYHHEPVPHQTALSRSLNPLQVPGCRGKLPGGPSYHPARIWPVLRGATIRLVYMTAGKE